MAPLGLPWHLESPRGPPWPLVDSRCSTGDQTKNHSLYFKNVYNQTPDRPRMGQLIVYYIVLNPTLICIHIYIWMRPDFRGHGNDHLAHHLAHYPPHCFGPVYGAGWGGQRFPPKALTIWLRMFPRRFRGCFRPFGPVCDYVVARVIFGSILG